MSSSTKPGFDWVDIPVGPFRMGTDPNQDAIAADDRWKAWVEKTEQPQHQVYLPAYRISRYPVTNQQWALFLRHGGYTWADRDKLWATGLPSGKLEHPVVWVTWRDALAFCEWAEVQLPSDAQWEKAARGADKRLYPWGNRPPTPDLANYEKNEGDTTAVTHYPKGQSPYGVYDMAGNTWEWISTLWGADKDDPEFVHPYRPDDGREDLANTDMLRTVRGGGWKYSSDLIRVACRDWNPPSVRGSALGFRVVTV
uniref:Formylglycine-generating enzyme, required for sulfatase activity, contains SUMF1/FGE domain n=1 Tax=Candidatus Kentrum sp. LPFa TaxID=2126335 RepID=A0A450WJZ8_9GAMM|nr:MAG: Formylglycine-generating enzyme, required for sulfatase activity, contains SUMF1/FGE domain [Candidatus Kentron sp. LPFa]